MTTIINCELYMDDLRNNYVEDDYKKICYKKPLNIKNIAKFLQDSYCFGIFKSFLEQNKNNKIIINKLLRNTTKYSNKTYVIDIIKLLLSYGADVNSANHNNTTALYRACKFKHDDLKIKIIKYLIENGADVNFKNEYDQTPLMTMLFGDTKNNFEIIKLLIIKGCNINYLDNFSRTPLMICADKFYNINNRYSIIKLLLDNKVDIYFQNKKGKNILKIIEEKSKKHNIVLSIKNENFLSDLVDDLSISTFDICSVYSLILNHKNIKNDHLCKFDIKFIYS